MRVIRTEMYFDDVVGVERKRRMRFRRDVEEKNDGLAFAWFRSGEPGPFDIRNQKKFRLNEISADEVPSILDALLRDVDGYEIESFRESLREPNQNKQIIDFVLDASIILEQSPPKAVPLKSLLKTTNSSILVGAYVGSNFAGDYPALMIFTIPLGIIVVSSALGIGDAMAAGLNKTIKRIFENHKK